MAAFQVKEFEGLIPCPLCRGVDCCVLDQHGRMTCGLTMHYVPRTSLLQVAKELGLKPRTAKEQSAYCYMPLDAWESDPIEVSRWCVALLSGGHHRTLYRCQYKGPTEAFLRQFIAEFAHDKEHVVVRIDRSWYQLYTDHQKTFFGSAVIEKIEPTK